MSPTKAILLPAVAFAAIGFLLVFVIDTSPTLTIGSFSEDESGDSGMPFLLFLTTKRAIGFGLIWLASLLAATAIGYRFAARHHASNA
jgi:hypothetical protein